MMITTIFEAVIAVQLLFKIRKLLISIQVRYNAEYLSQIAVDFEVTINSIKQSTDTSSTKKYQLTGGKQDWDVIWKVDHISNYILMFLSDAALLNKDHTTLLSFVLFVTNCLTLLVEANIQNLAQCRRIYLSLFY